MSGRIPLAERIDRLTDKDGECWLWLGAVGPKGYARMDVEGRRVHAHRVSYEAHVGPIPDGLVIDHLCRVRHCMNPAHLEPVTNKVNILRGVSVPAQLARRTECKHGHAYERLTTGKDAGRRYCRTCRNKWKRDRRAERRGCTQSEA